MVAEIAYVKDGVSDEGTFRERVTSVLAGKTCGDPRDAADYSKSIAVRAAHS